MSTYKEGPIMQEIHRIRDELFQEYKNSGLSYAEWWQKQEEKLNSDLLQAGFQIIQKNGVAF